MSKLSFFNKKIFDQFRKRAFSLAAVFSSVLMFIDIPREEKLFSGGFYLIVLIIIYFWIWLKSKNMSKLSLIINNSNVLIKSGDIFKEEGFKIIPCNEYFDTIVDEIIITSKSLHGIFVNKYTGSDIDKLNQHIEMCNFAKGGQKEKNLARKRGKQQRYEIGTICLYGEYILTAFSKFDEENKAYLTMPEYIQFLFSLWDNINRIYAQQNISVPIFGSGITRIEEHGNINDEELLSIMLWTFKLSKVRFKDPAKLSIIIHPDKLNKINLFNISDIY